MTTLTVVIPAYNEENGIADIIHRIMQVKKDLTAIGIEELELIVVDDGSSDKTAEIASSIPGVTLIQHERNKGYGGALKTGFGQARGDLIGFLDADGTYPPEYFPQLCKRILSNECDLVIGSRMAGASSQMPITRRIGNLFFAGLISVLSRQRITDSASGMRVFRREVLQKVYPLPDGLNLTPIMTTRAIHEDVLMSEVPVPYTERVGTSKLNVVRDGSIYLQSITWTVLTYNPVRIFGAVGLLGISIAAAVLLGIVWARFTGTTTLGPMGVVSLFVALVAAVTGVSVFSLGITFNYLVSLFYKRPIRQGLFGKPILKFPLDYHFGWLGAVSLVLGLALAVTSIMLSLNGWETTRLWFYMLGSAMMILVGTQMMIYWVLLRVLDELSHREAAAQKDMQFHLSV